MPSIVPDDLVAYASEYFPGLEGDFDNSTCGGGIDETMRIIFTDIPVDNVVGYAHDYIILETVDTANNMNATVYGRAQDGTLVSQTRNLLTNRSNGQIVFDDFGNSVDEIERILAVKLASNANSNIIVKTGTGTAIGTVYANEKGFTRLFINAYSDIDAAKDYYMKFFWKNNNTTNTLINAIVKEAGESTQNNPSSELIKFALADTIDDDFAISKRVWASNATPTDNSITPVSLLSRLTIPPNNNNDPFKQTGNISVPGSNLPKDQAIGVWLKFSLTASAAPVKGVYTSQLFGLST